MSRLGKHRTTCGCGGELDTSGTPPVLDTPSHTGSWTQMTVPSTCNLSLALYRQTHSHHLLGQQGRWTSNVLCSRYGHLLSIGKIYVVIIVLLQWFLFSKVPSLCILSQKRPPTFGRRWWKYSVLFLWTKTTPLRRHYFTIFHWHWVWLLLREKTVF